MVELYVTPSLIKQGNSKDVVKGSCGFGVENWSLNQTGASRSNWRTMVEVSRMPIPACCGRIGTDWIVTRRCQSENRCSTRHDC